MALDDGLRLLVESWDDVEPRLPVVVLRALVEPSDNSFDVLPFSVGRTVYLATILSDYLPEGHPARLEITQGVTRVLAAFAHRDRWAGNVAIDADVAESVGMAETFADVCIELIRAALANPSIVLDEQADALAESWRQEVLRDCVLWVDDGFFDSRPLVIKVGDAEMYPRFQIEYIHDTPIGIHPIVSRLSDQLRADEDPLGAISWWLSSNAWLHRPPSELLGQNQDAEIEYAVSQLNNDNW
ncbi:MAG TPA: hypothetical protein VF477_10580 [Mycobacterium sp.]